jgi:hypothetical protein
MMTLVGWSAANPKLRSEEAYDVAYDTLYELLPDCNHEGWCGAGINREQDLG